MTLIVDGLHRSIEIEVARRYRQRLLGLIGRQDFVEGQGFLIPRCRSIHMFFMRFAIDAVFINDRDRVVLLRVGLKPWRTATCWRARAVLELPAGGAAILGIRENSHVQIMSADIDGGN